LNVKPTVPPEILKKYGFTTADKISPPPPKSRPKFQVERLDLPPLTPEEKHAFKLLHPYGLCIVATDGPLSATSYDPVSDDRIESFGHNQLCWPVRLNGTASWQDEVTANWNRNPVAETRVKWRLWVRRLDEREALILHVGETIRRAAEAAGYRPMYAGFQDVGPRFKALEFGRDVELLARRMGVFSWTDRTLAAFLKAAVCEARERGVYITDQRGRKVAESSQFTRIVDRLAEKEAAAQIGRRG
jgi:hypothetical protein